MRGALVLVVATWLGSSSARAQLDEAREALLAGRYEEAVSAFSRHIAENGHDAEAYKGLIQALSETGEYGRAQEQALAFQQARGDSAALASTVGEILYATGRIEEARKAFERTVSSKASDRLEAELNLAVVLYDQGETEEAMRRFDAFIDVYNLSDRLSSEDLTAVGIACQYLGVDNSQLFKDALKAFDEAIAADGQNLEPLLREGELFLEKYNSPDARESFEKVLARNPRHPRALLGLARVMHFDGSPEAYTLTKKALEVNPHLVAARVFKGRLELDLEDYGRARREAEEALEVNPLSSEALSLLATACTLGGDTPCFEAAQAKVLGRNPRYADFYNTLADACVRTRLYSDALDFARQAVKLDPKSWRGYGLLGLNELRLGAIDEGRKHLERSFAGDPYNVWVKNTLDLIDTFAGYRATKSDRFVVFAEDKESDVMALYALSLAEEAYARLAARYHYRPATPIRVEIYPSHADFSVRTIGLAGLGALGVCFGPVVAMDSPSARKKATFNWGSTLWHELTHTVTLGMTNNKVPRWLSEGLSVVEERRARPGWGDNVTIPFLMAFKEGKLLPIRELNNGFVRPSSPHQIPISYYQASLVCELIEREYGFGAMLDLLAGYKEGLETEEIFRSVLGCDSECLDGKLQEFLKERFAAEAAALRRTEGGESLRQEDLRSRADKDPKDFLAQLAVGVMLFEQDDGEAVTYLERAKGLFPDYAAKDSPYWLLAQIHKRRGDEQKAMEELTRLVSINASHYAALVELADSMEASGNKKGAAEMLARTIYVYPFEIPLHRRLAELYRDLGDHPKCLRERKALVALEVADRAQVLYELALAYYESGDRVRARREVLRALEIAPGFDEALELLLKLQPGQSEELR